MNTVSRERNFSRVIKTTCCLNDICNISEIELLICNIRCCVLTNRIGKTLRTSPAIYLNWINVPTEGKRNDLYFAFPWWLRWSRICLQHRRPRVNPWFGNTPWRKALQPLQCSCLLNPHGLRSLVGYSPWGCKESDMTEQLSTAQSNTQLHKKHSTWLMNNVYIYFWGCE